MTDADYKNLMTPEVRAICQQAENRLPGIRLQQVVLGLELRPATYDAQNPTGQGEKTDTAAEALNQLHRYLGNPPVRHLLLDIFYYLPTPVTPGQYLHFKGGVYHVDPAVQVVRECDTLVEYVVYKPNWGKSGWVRPVSDFFQNVNTDKGRIPRFELQRTTRFNKHPWLVMLAILCSCWGLLSSFWFVLLPVVDIDRSIMIRLFGHDALGVGLTALACLLWTTRSGTRHE
jgi:hypothetical protein